MKRGFWIILSLVLAVIVHLCYMLYQPTRSFEATLRSLVKNGTQNQFSVLSPAQQVKLLPFATDHDVVGICFFDLRGGAIKIVGQAPAGFWNFSVFTSHGRQVYDLNDTQVETNQFVVELTQAPGLLAQILGRGDREETVLRDAGWQVQVTEQQGLAVLWTPLHDTLMRASTEAVIRQSTCKPESET